jgi:TonB family protein
VTSGKADVKPEPASDRGATAKPAAPVSAERRDATKSAADAVKTASEKQPSAVPPIAAEVKNTEPKSADAAAKPVVQPGRPGKGEVLDQVLPDVSPEARATIHGHVRIAVKVHVDAAGAVSDASLDTAGPSQFFADQALKAAKRWAFTPPEVDGKSVESEWLLHFVITPTDTKVTPVQTAP